MCTGFVRTRKWSQHFVGPIGAHLQLTDGRQCSAISKARSLVDARGAFPGRGSLLLRVEPGEVAIQWRLQSCRSVVSGGLEIDAPRQPPPCRSSSPFSVSSATVRSRGQNGTRSDNRATPQHMGIPAADHCDCTTLFGILSKILTVLCTQQRCWATGPYSPARRSRSQANHPRSPASAQ
jgi:hypothetical protein